MFLLDRSPELTSQTFYTYKTIIKQLLGISLLFLN